jgi:glycoside/pentoside/hexuronide:cation symporter, GPH family
MYAAAAPVAISFVLLWNPPSGWSDWALFAYLLATVLFTQLATSFYEVPSAALAPELAPDYHERTVLLSYRFVIGVIGGALGSVMAFGIFLRATPEYPAGQLNPAGYGPLSVAVAAIVIVAVLVSTLGTHHKIKTLHVPLVQKLSFMQSLREVGATLNNWNFMVAVAASLIAGVGTGISGGLRIYFGTFFWDLSSQEILLLSLAGLIAAPLGSFVATATSRAFGKRRACMTLFFLSVATNNTPILLRLVGLFPENDSRSLLPILFAEAVVTGVLAIAGFIIVSSMIADIVEDSQAKTGRRSEGLLFSADSLLQKIVTSLSTVLPGLILAFVNFPERAQPGQVPVETLHQLAWIYIPATMTISILSISTWSFYRIDKAGFERARATIAESTAAAEARLERDTNAPPA